MTIRILCIDRPLLLHEFIVNLDYLTDGKTSRLQGIDWQLDIACLSTLPSLQDTEQELHLRHKIDGEDRALNANNMSQQGVGDQVKSK